MQVNALKDSPVNASVSLSDHMNNGSHSESACRRGREFIIITVRTLQQSSHLTLCSLSRDVYKNAWMNSTLKTIPNKWFYWSVVSPHNYLRGVELWIVLMDHGQACRLVLTDDNMIVQLFQHNKSETKCCTPCCQEQRSQLQLLSSPVNFQPIRFQSIAFHLKPNFCYLQCNIFMFSCCTGLVIYHIGFAVWAQIDTVQTPIKWSLLALNLPAFLPQALEMEKVSLGVTMLYVLIQRNPTAVLFSLPRSLCLCKPPSQQHAPAQGKRSAIIEVFIYFFISSLFLVSPRTMFFWVCYGKSFSVCVLMSHDCLKRKCYLFRKQGGGINTNVHRGEWIAFLSALQSIQTSAGEREKNCCNTPN